MADIFSNTPDGVAQPGTQPKSGYASTGGAGKVGAPLTVRRLLAPGQPSSLPTIRDMVRGLAEDGNFSAEAVLQIEMAVDEACTNIIEHAYRHRPLKHEVEVVASMFTDRLEIVINDYSPVDFPVDVATSIAPDEYLGAERRRGLGLYIINNFVDRVEHRFQDGLGNELRLTKFCG